MQTGAGDISATYQNEPDSLTFDIVSGSEDLSVKFSSADYQKVNPRSHLYGLAIQDFPAHSQPIYTTLTPKSTTWSPDNKSQVGPVLPV